MKLLAKSNLRQLILALVVFSIGFTVLSMFFSGARVQKQALIDTTLETNESRAVRFAKIAQLGLNAASDQLSFAAHTLAEQWLQPIEFVETLEFLAQDNAFFHNIYAVEQSGQVIAATSEAAITAELPAKKSKLKHDVWLSEAYVNPAQQFVVSMLAPILTDQGEKLGYVVGTTNLSDYNFMYKLIGDGYRDDGSYLYIIDRQNRLLFHPEMDRIGETLLLSKNSLLGALAEGNTGNQIITNSQGVEMLAGYAPIPALNWSLVSQRPTSEVMNAHNSLLLDSILSSLPYNLAALVLVWFLADLICWPLRVLAINARKISRRKTIERVKILNAWYYEAQELKRALLYGLENVHAKVDQLQHDADIDPLTGLNNRRVLEPLMERYSADKTSFCAIAFDVDRFKSVNDKWGHAVGDQVLQELSRIVSDSSRQNDVCVRLGGEEFLILMAECSLDVASKVAERLRQKVMDHSFPEVEQVTISLGVAAWPEHGETPEDVLRIVDDMLYRAKREGRNKVYCAPVLASVGEYAYQDED